MIKGGIFRKRVDEQFIIEREHDVMLFWSKFFAAVEEKGYEELFANMECVL